ncbi:nuclear transport factor 2 family protein [Sphingosinicella sp. LHD-64]|uniref:nuclear transport factor 2 family protein n=1 Tax=Sphingosinicella sp. LHD-64 TaxID=3072139 RepID=UPI00280D59FD|nr:nuclear transport factor 2 family protein [Sphingosinicella sp. LHD-64]MDQ8756091.1 nuclear transport factor 2 family protein [Sphingosinicella sp. LHD-64]
MTPEQNKAVLRRVWDAFAEGDTRPFVAAMADDFTWIMEGTNAWSGRYEGKTAVREKILRPLAGQFATTYRNRAERMIAEDDTVVVLCRGEVMTTAGRPYNNSYCYVIRMQGGQMIELREYFDTELVTAALAPPPAA